MSTSPICPNCQMHRVLYVQDVTQHSIILEIDDDGFVEVGNVEDETLHDDFHFLCKGCGFVYETLEDLQQGKGKVPGKK